MIDSNENTVAIFDLLTLDVVKKLDLVNSLTTAELLCIISTILDLVQALAYSTLVR